MAKLVEPFLNSFEQDSELRLALNSWYQHELNTNLKSTKEEIDQIVSLLNLIKKEKVESKEYEQNRKRVIRFLTFHSIRFQDAQKKLKEKNKESTREVDPTIPVYPMEESIYHLISSQRKVEKLRSIHSLETSKQKKLKDLIDICEALGSVQSKETNVKLLLREKLLQILNALIMQYGGYGFFALLDIPTNSALGASTTEKHWDDIEFIDYVWSTSTNLLVEDMKNLGLTQPKFSNTPLFRQTVLSKRWRVLPKDSFKLPEGHFEMNSTLVVPVVVNKQTVCLLGLSNGQYNSQDAEIIFEILPRMWTNVIMESINKANRKQEDTEKLQMIEHRLELGKKLILGLTNVLKRDDELLAKLSREKILKRKIGDIADFLEEKYGGMTFVAPLSVEMNTNLLKLTKDTSSSTSASDDEKTNKEKFLNFQFSQSAIQIRKTVMKDEKKPVLLKAAMMLKVVRSKKPLLITETSKLKLPKNHFPLTNALLIPICINDECVALVGMANGKFSEVDGEVLFDILATSWFTILRDCFSRIDTREANEQAATQKLTQKEYDICPENYKQIAEKVTKFDNLTVIIITNCTSHSLSTNSSVMNFVEFINSLFTRYDSITSQFRLMKLGTSSDQYICASGLASGLLSDQLTSAANFAIAIMEDLAIVNKSQYPKDLKKNFPIKLKISMATASSIGGMMGSEEKFQYNVFGEAMEIAKEMDKFGKPDQVLLNEVAFENLKDRFDLDEDSKVSLEGVGEFVTYHLKGKKQFFSIKKE